MIGSLAPVVVFAYNRPEHLSRTLTALAAADGAAASQLWLFCDGPKPNQDPTLVESARAVARNSKWTEHFSEVVVECAERNKGLAASIIGGVSEVLKRFDSVIVLEDDLIVAPDFLLFVNDCLCFYRDNEKVGSVTGFCPLKVLPRAYSHDVMTVPRNSSQGWGTWADRWQRVDWDAKEATRLWREYALSRRFNLAGSDRVDRLRRQLAGQIDSWSIRFGLWQLLEGRYTIYPVDNRIKNIGYDGSGVHSGVSVSKNELIIEAQQPYTLSFPPENRAVLGAFRRTYSGSLPRRLVRHFRTRMHSLKF